MQIFVKTLSGRTVALSVERSEAIESVRAKIAEIECIEEADLFFGGAELADDMTVESCHLQQESTINVVVPLEGGKGKKKKKKVFSKAKKPIHRHKNVPMRVLKFYKVTGDDDEAKVSHERMECPHPNCGAGVFMAAHKDRQTCGKCSLTYVFQKK
jgi:small subunit ribosomal protein S27Ae